MSLKVICIGAGYFARFQYNAWKRIPETTIVAALNRTPEKLTGIAEEYGIPRVAALADLEAVLDEEKPDFVDIITPPETHLDLVERIAAKGIHIICQKPVAPSEEESRAVVEAAARHGVRLMIHENWRWQPWYREMKRQLDANAIGELYSISVRMRMGDGWPEDAYMARQPFFRDYPRLLIYETGVHFLDTFRFLGGEITSIYARLQQRNSAIKGEDAGQVVCGFASGATAVLDASRYNEADTADARYTFGTVRLDGSKGHLELDLDGGLTLKPLGEAARAIDYFHERRDFAGDCVHAIQRHFVDSVLNDTPFESTGEDYLKTVALVEAAYRSAQSDQVEHLSASTPPSGNS